MSKILLEQINSFYTHLTDNLDISDEEYNDAVEKYNQIAAWLGQSNSELIGYSPDLYPQGSFALGTVTKPIDLRSEFDVDLVCQLDITKDEISKEDIKTLIGDRLKKFQAITNKVSIEEKKRCWSLNYIDTVNFHMDVLPAIPDSESTHLHAILIPDRELHLWQHSNPREYVEWFKKRMELRRIALMEKYAAEFRVNIDDVPEYEVKTPLQRSIQIMKRHRDFMFRDDLTYKPISIIITTLAAKAYSNEDNIYDTLNNIIPNMSRFISVKNDLTWIGNPTNDEENFAERWNEDPKFEEYFMTWLKQIQADVRSTIGIETIGSFIDTVNPIFGEDLTKSAFEKTASAFGISVGAQKVIPNVTIGSKPSKPWGN